MKQKQFQGIINQYYQGRWSNAAALIAPRVGKTRIVLGLISPTDKVLVLYPNKTVKKSWVDEIQILGLDVNVTYSTYLSAKKHADTDWDWVIGDEIHKASTRQWGYLNQLKGRRKFLMSGTIKWKTKKTLLENHYPIIIDYPISEAIKDGIVTDLKVTLVKVKLDNDITKKYERLCNKIDELMYDVDDKGQKHFRYLDTSEQRQLKFLALERMRLLHRSKNKLKACSYLMNEFKDKRLLLFSTEMKLLDALDIPAYHSGNPDEELKNEFCSGKGLKLGVLKMFNQGVTVVPINLCIIHNFSSNPEELAQQMNRVTALEYANDDKIARIYIIVIQGTQEEKWVQTALEFIPEDKILTYYYDKS